MKRLNNIIVLLTLISMLGATTSAFAEENAFRDTFQSAFYGGAVGALVGAALMAFTKRPADHFENIAYGAAVGVLAGTAYGVVKSSRSFASFDNGSIKIAMPTIFPDLVESPVTKQTTVAWRADLLRGTFN
jgi:uncharacterized membrane protein YebE (DUF533 family)